MGIILLLILSGKSFLNSREAEVANRTSNPDKANRLPIIAAFPPTLALNDFNSCTFSTSSSNNNPLGVNCLKVNHRLETYERKGHKYEYNTYSEAAPC